jgi:hypothetical protein
MPSSFRDLVEAAPPRSRLFCARVVPTARVPALGSRAALSVLVHASGDGRPLVRSSEQSLENRMKTLSSSVLLAASMMIAGAASAHEVVYTAVMNGPAEAPPNNSPGTGFATITVDLDLARMYVVAEFRDLIGTVTAAHIHGPTATPFVGTAGVMTPTPTFPGFPSGVRSGRYEAEFDLTLASSYNPAFINASGGTISQAMNRMLASFAEGRAYFNIHTTSFTGGEIRGFLVPAPGATGVLAVAGLFAARRRRN